MKTPAILLVLFMLAFISCRQEKLPEDRLEDAEIYFFGKQDGESVLMIAGEDSLYNYTSLEENSHHIYELTSKLGHLKSPNDKKYLEIIIWDAQSTENPLEGGKRFELGERELLDQSDYIKSNNFQMVPNFNEVVVDEFYWELGSFGKSVELRPQPSLQAKGAEWICLTCISPEGDSISTCKRISMSNHELYNPKLKIIDRDENAVVLEANVSGVSPDQWIWNGQSSNEQTRTFTMEDISEGRIHNVKIMNNGVLLFDSDFLLDTFNDQIDLKYQDFSSMQLGKEYADIQQTGKVIVNYFIPERGLFSTRFMNTRENMDFHINKDAFFRQNEEGIPTRKLNIRFNLPMITEMGDSLHLNTTGSIMAFPNP